MNIDYSSAKDMEKTVSVKKVVEELDLEVINFPEDKFSELVSMEINRPGLQLAGYFDIFNYNRLQLLGVSEMQFLETLLKERQEEVLEKFMGHDLPMILISSGQEVNKLLLEKAKKYGRVLTRSKMGATKLISKVSTYLNEQLAPEIIIHGVLVDVDGTGILIVGESGIGKSETALELIRRNHRLVADDAVRIIKIDDDTLRGSAPDMLINLLEVRGLGILDIKSLYGTGSVKTSKKINMVIKLENWVEGKYYDRLGVDEVYMEILGNKLDCITVPIRPGRNIAIIIEIAARNYILKKQGIRPADELGKKLVKSFGGNSGDE